LNASTEGQERQAPSESSRDPVHVYLDQWVWIQLARVETGRSTDPIATAALEAIRKSAASGVASFPLSATTYIEFDTGVSADQRQSLGQTMLDISGQDSIRQPGPEVSAWELDLYLRRRHGKPERPRAISVFGRWCAHTFGNSRLLPGLHVDPASIPADLDAGQREALEQAALEATGSLLLLGNPMEDVVPGYNRLAIRVFDERFAQEERTFAVWLQQWPRERWADAQYTRSLVRDVLPQVADALLLAQLPQSVLPAVWNEWVDLLRNLPSLWALTELKRMQHANPGRSWERQDHGDLIALSMAIAYCDIVVVDNHWSHQARSANLDQLNGTVVSSLRDLPTNLARAVRH
jgi:hypothetical protein